MKLLCITLLLVLRHTTSDIIVKNDEFHGYLNGIYHKFIDKNGAKWELPTNQNKLELLLNDYYNERYATLETCTNELYGMPSSSQPGTNITFKEVAQVSHVTF